MDLGALIIIAVIVLAILGVWLLPLRKRWNDDGADDDARAGLTQEDESE